MDKHTERLKSMAEKMAKCEYSRSSYLVGFINEDWDKLPKWVKVKEVNRMLPLAELALRECADEVTKALSHGYHVKSDEIKGEPSRGYGGKYLQSRGLIPAKTNE